MTYVRRDHAEIYVDEAGEYRLRVVAANGNILLSTEGYTRKADAVEIVKSRFGSMPIEYLDEAEGSVAPSPYNEGDG